MSFGSKGACAAKDTVRMECEKLHSGVKTFAGLGCATLASASALPCSASRDYEWQICLSDVQEKNNSHSSSLFLFYTFLLLSYSIIHYTALFV